MGEDIPISLVVKKAPNTICLPNDDDYHSITKVMHVSLSISIKVYILT
ncbi:MAG: hypothetical protein AB8B74_11105 [Crocinitomicaceae bacterium]